MTKRHFAMALLVTFVLAGAVTLRSFESHRHANKVADLTAQLQDTQGELEQMRALPGYAALVAACDGDDHRAGPKFYQLSSR